VRRSLSSFQRLALWTTATTYFLIMVGGLVRASGAGLGCPDWPRCFGSWIPPASAAALPPPFDPSQFNATLMWTEYVNRLLGVTVGFLIFSTVVSAWRHHRHEPHILWTSVAAFLLVGFEGWLGGRVVAHDLAAWIVTVHMIVALIIVSLLLYATAYAFYHPASGPTGAALTRAGEAAVARRLLGRGVWALLGLTLVQVVLGTLVRGRVDEALDAAVARTDAVAWVGAAATWHRDVAFVVLMGALVLLLRVWSRHAREARIVQWANIVAGLAVAQVALGAALAFVALVPAGQIGHLTLASLLLGAQTMLLLLVRWEPAGEEQEEEGGG